MQFSTLGLVSVSIVLSTLKALKLAVRGFPSGLEVVNRLFGPLLLLMRGLKADIKPISQLSKPVRLHHLPRSLNFFLQVGDGGLTHRLAKSPILFFVCCDQFIQMKSQRVTLRHTWSSFERFKAVCTWSGEVGSWL